MKNLIDYDVKILLAFGEACRDCDKKFFKWLMDNDFPELAAFANSINSDIEAFNWLLKNGYPHYAILSNAIDGEETAYEWLVKHKLNFYVVFADACRGKEKAVEWLKNNNLGTFIQLSIIIKDIIEKQRRDFYDPHKLKFSF